VFSTVLIANRGEIAVRIIRTLRRLGMRSAAVYSDADAGARHVALADVAVRIGPAHAAQSYLNMSAVLHAASAVGADAVHPGYGFLSENAEFAQACAAAGLVFVGPPPEAIEAMGDKGLAKRTVERAGVPVVPGIHAAGLSAGQLHRAVRELGFPVLLKPSAGGGGKGMHRVDRIADLDEAIASSRREALAAFGDDTLLIERWIERPRHVEVQILADRHGSVIHLGERECSLQRRHQKVVEEAPSPLLSTSGEIAGELRAAIGDAAVRVARGCGYAGVGTVELIVSADSPEDFYFIEMNTRLQVEHAVTELVTGIDLVEQQLRVAAGQPLGLRQQDVTVTGHAIEARVYAEDPAQQFLPAAGRILLAREPDGVRVDSGIEAGTYVGSSYDPMLAKVIAWAPTRDQAIRRLDAALAETSILGLQTNAGFLRALMSSPDVRAGRLDTGLIERLQPGLVAPDEPPLWERAAAAILARLAEIPHDASPFLSLVGWRLGPPPWTRHVLITPDHQLAEVELRGSPAQGAVLDGTGHEVEVEVRLDGHDLALTLDRVTRHWTYARDERGIWLGRGGSAWLLRERAPTSAGSGARDAHGPLVSPLPGTVTAVHVAAGDQVAAGAAVVTVEAMKMEYVVRAPAAGQISELSVRIGQSVRLGATLAIIEPDIEHAAM
jgi:acetyl-CoA/propionyl-CoA carboxylase biotin carboxyl carrier protein